MSVQHQFSSVLFSRSVVSDSLRPHGLQQARLPCPSPTPGVYSNSCPSSWWCHPTISSSVVPFSSHLQSFPASGSFLLSQFSGGHIIGASALVSVLPMNIQDWIPLELTGLISFQSMELSRVFSNTTFQKHQSFGTQLSSQSNSDIPTWLLGKTIALTRRTLVGKVMSLLLNILCRLVITFLPRSKHLLISWLQSQSVVILEPKNKICHCFHCFHLFPMKWWDQMPWSSFSECWALSQLFHSPLSLSSRGFLVPLHFLP